MGQRDFKSGKELKSLALCLSRFNDAIRQTAETLAWALATRPEKVAARRGEHLCSGDHEDLAGMCLVCRAQR